MRRYLRPAGRAAREARFRAAQRLRARTAPEVVWAGTTPRTPAERYWSRHTVVQPPLFDRRRSRAYFEWLRDSYPLIDELMAYDRTPPGRVLDYGCGTGDGITRFALQGAEHVTGVDVSRRALQIAAARLALHNVPSTRVSLVQVADEDRRIPADDGTFDWVHCHGVVQHTTDPAAVLRELARVLAPGGGGRLMVYNRDSVWFHLYVPWVLQLQEGIDADLPVEEAFRRSTDGPDCPVSRAYRPADFVALAADAGLRLRYLGGYSSVPEQEALRRLPEALADERLAEEHRAFLTALDTGERGLPAYDGFSAGIGGCFAIES